MEFGERGRENIVEDGCDVAGLGEGSDDGGLLENMDQYGFSHVRLRM